MPSMKASRVWVTALLCVLSLGTMRSVRANDLPRADPEQLGFSSEKLQQIDQFYADKVRRGEIAGIVTLVARHGKIAHYSAIGYADVEAQRKMETNTLFRYYSMTKPIASVALMMLYEQGRVQLTDPLSKYIPEFAQLRVLRDPNGPLDETVAPLHAPTVEDALRHTTGFTHGLGTDAYDSLYTRAQVLDVDTSLEDMMHKLAHIPLKYQPETRFAYSVGPDIAARLVEVISGQPFDQYLAERIFRPLHMKDTGFWVPSDQAQRLAPVHWLKDGHLVPLDEAHGHPVGGILYEPAGVNSYLVNHRRKGGSYGLVGTAADYWRFAQMMLNGGRFEGVQILSPQTVRFMTRDHLPGFELAAPGDPPGGLGFGLGFGVVKDPGLSGEVSSEGNYFWGGAAHTVFWIDPKEDLVVVAMTQHMEVPGADALDPQLHALVYGALKQ